MSMYTHPQNDAQASALKAVLDALGIPYETAGGEEETAYLLSTEANKKRLLDAIENEGKGGRRVSLDEVWK